MRGCLRRAAQSARAGCAASEAPRRRGHKALRHHPPTGAQRAFHSAIGSALDYLEALRAEQHRVSEEGPHPLALPICRLISAWLMQPSSPSSLELHDRAHALLPFTDRLVAQEPAEWARLLQRELAESEAPSGLV